MKPPPRYCTEHASTPAEWIADVGEVCATPECGRTVTRIDREMIGAVPCIVTTVEPGPAAVEL